MMAVISPGLHVKLTLRRCNSGSDFGELLAAYDRPLTASSEPPAEVVNLASPVMSGVCSSILASNEVFDPSLAIATTGGHATRADVPCGVCVGE